MRKIDEPLPFRQLDAERLLAERRFARLERRAADGFVREWWREVHDRIDGGVAQHLVEHPGVGAVRRAQRSRPARLGVDARRQLHELELRDGVRVRTADDAAADDRDPERLAGHLLPRE